MSQKTPRAKKQFGQHFLKDEMIISDIIHIAQFDNTDRVIEIGPGYGALTQSLLTVLNQLTAIEVDRDTIQTLSSLPGADKLTLIHQDVLTIDFEKLIRELGEPVRLIGNLPYNIATPLIIQLASKIGLVRDMLFMVQLEVAERLTAQTGAKAYSRLSVITQHFTDADIVLEVPKEAFNPPPKVESAVVKLTPKQNVKGDPLFIKTLENLTRHAFHMRRKTLRNNLKGFLDDALLEQVGIDPSLRPDAVSVSQYEKLAELIVNEK